MKKRYLVGLVLLSFVAVLSGCKRNITTKRFMAHGYADSDPYIVFTEYYEKGEFSYVILDEISDSKTKYKINNKCPYCKTDTNFSPNTIDGVTHNYSFKDGKAWSCDVNCNNFVFDNGKKSHIIGVEYGQANCSCNQKGHFVFNFKTDETDANGRYMGRVYLSRDLATIE